MRPADLDRFRPMPLRTVREPFDATDFVFEVKYDGYRALAFVEADAVSLVSRRQHVYRQFDDLRTTLRKELSVQSAVLDGEVCCRDDQGRSQFHPLLRRKGLATFVAFDVLMLEGVDLRGLPLEERKRRLRRLIPTKATGILYLDHVEGTGVALYDAVCRRDLEGIVAKPRTSAYRIVEPLPWRKIPNPHYSQKVGRAELFHPKRTRDYHREQEGEAMAPAKKATKKRGTGKRELIDTGTDKRFVKRTATGQFKESADVGKSLAADRLKKAKTKVKSGRGDRGDR